jgi:transposase InsO family protein
LPQEAASATRQLTAEQKLLILDSWQRSGLPAIDFGALVGVSNQTLYAWKRRFKHHGPAGLDDQAKKKMPTGSRLPEVTKRTILMLKNANPQWGCQRISDVLYRGPGLPASAPAVARVLKEAGYVTEEHPTHPHPDHPRSFERATPNQLWQSDLFTFILKRQNRRVYLVAFMDDHSRFIVGYGLHASQSAALVLEVFRAAVVSCGAPQEVLTDNGAQYITWRGTSLFARELQKRGIQHIVSAPRHPQTLGKIERFWGTLWRECLDAAIFIDLEDARRRIGHFIDYYNLQRPHQSLEGLTPADRFFGAAPQTLGTLKARVQANALELARGGLPKAPFYLTGQVGGKPFSVHAEGERVYMLAEDGQRKEIDLAAPQPPAEPVPMPLCAQGIVNSELADETEPPPGTSPLDQSIEDLTVALAPQLSQPLQTGGKA